MALTVFFFCLLTVASAIFFPFLQLPNAKTSLMRVCIYSVDPNQYTPKCFLCPSSVYPNAVKTCVNANSIPSNVTYAQARCLEQNCMINRGKRSISTDSDNTLESNQVNPVSGPGVQLHQLSSPLANTSLIDGADRKSDLGKNVEIVGEEETLAVEDTEWEVEIDEEFAD